VSDDLHAAYHIATFNYCFNLVSHSTNVCDASCHINRGDSTADHNCCTDLDTGGLAGRKSERAVKDRKREMGISREGAWVH
jgi:hypothetical protein